MSAIRQVMGAELIAVLRDCIDVESLGASHGNVADALTELARRADAADQRRRVYERRDRWLQRDPMFRSVRHRECDHGWVTVDLLIEQQDGHEASAGQGIDCDYVTALSAALDAVGAPEGS